MVFMSGGKQSRLSGAQRADVWRRWKAGGSLRFETQRMIHTIWRISLLAPCPESKPVGKLTQRLLESIRVFEKCRVTSFEYFQMMIGKLFKGGFAALQWNNGIVFRPRQQHRATDFMQDRQQVFLGFRKAPPCIFERGGDLVG